MGYDPSVIEEKLRRWEQYLENYQLPTWEELPDFGLYMDQVVALISRYLDFLPPDEQGNKAITVSTVNNYVRLKIMPAPVKKKYNRIHLAYLLMICTLKQNLSIAYVQRMIPMGLTEDEVHERYNSFVARQKAASNWFIAQVQATAKRVFSEGALSADGFVDTIAVSAGLAQILTEKLLGLSKQEDNKEK